MRSLRIFARWGPLIILIVCLFASLNFIRYFLDRNLLAAFERIGVQPGLFSDQISIIDTSTIYDLEKDRTDRQELVDLLRAVRLAEPKMVGLDILLKNEDPSYSSADSTLRQILDETEMLIYPSDSDTFFIQRDYSRLASIKINNAFEITVRHGELLSLPFAMAARSGIRFPDVSTFHINYSGTFDDLKAAGQIISARMLLAIMNDDDLDRESKVDSLSQLLGSQYILIGFCNQRFAIDLHATPFGTQPGILIWANAFNNLLMPAQIIRYSPLWINILLIIMVTISISALLRVYRQRPSLYYIAYGLILAGHLLLWPCLSYILFTCCRIFVPVFSFLFIAIIAFPLFRFLKGVIKLHKIDRQKRELAALPARLRFAFGHYAVEDNPFKKLIILFTVIEECIKFSALLGMAQKIQSGMRIAFQPYVIHTHPFGKFTLGQWQGIMRDLVLNLKEISLLDEWKRIYLDQDEYLRWQPNDIFQKMEKSGEILKKFHEKTIKGSASARVIQSSAGYKHRIKEFFSSIKTIRWLQVRALSRYLSGTVPASWYESEYIVALRNRVVHSGGVFIQEKEYTNILIELEGVLAAFQQRLAFWGDCSIYLKKSQYIKNEKVDGMEDAAGQLILSKNGHDLVLSPFFIMDYCTIHKRQELFWLEEADLTHNLLFYKGDETKCRLMSTSQHECNKIIRTLD